VSRWIVYLLSPWKFIYFAYKNPDVILLSQKIQAKLIIGKRKFPFLANVNSRSRSLYVIGRPSDYRLSVVCLSVTFVCPTQAIEIFGDVSTPFGTLAICWHPNKILQRSSQGNPSAGGVKHKNIAILDTSNAISQKLCKIEAKFVLITNRKSHMSFRLVPNSVTLDDLERHFQPLNRCNFTAKC